jgi:hypothetical protein
VDGFGGDGKGWRDGRTAVVDVDVEAAVEEDVEAEAEGERRVVIFSSSSLRGEERWMMIRWQVRGQRKIISHLYLFIYVTI